MGRNLVKPAQLAVPSLKKHKFMLSTVTFLIKEEDNKTT